MTFCCLRCACDERWDVIRACLNFSEGLPVCYIVCNTPKHLNHGRKIEEKLKMINAKLTKQKDNLEKLVSMVRVLGS